MNYFFANIPGMLVNVEDIHLACNGYEGYDPSHDIGHALAVLCNAHHFALEQNFPPELQLATEITALFHDINDHKYREHWKVSPETVQAHFHRRLGEVWARRAIFTMENMSWSKRQRVDTSHPDYHPLLFITVRDSDWIEAIGPGGISRCIAFSRAHGGKFPEDVMKHLEEKLLHIYPALECPPAKRQARPLHQAMVDWYTQHR